MRPGALRTGEAPKNSQDGATRVPGSCDSAPGSCDLGQGGGPARTAAPRGRSAATSGEADWARPRGGSAPLARGQNENAGGKFAKTAVFRGFPADARGGRHHNGQYRPIDPEPAASPQSADATPERHVNHDASQLAAGREPQTSAAGLPRPRIGRGTGHPWASPRALQAPTPRTERLAPPSLFLPATSEISRHGVARSRADSRMIPATISPTGGHIVR